MSGTGKRKLQTMKSKPPQAPRMLRGVTRVNHHALAAQETMKTKTMHGISKITTNVEK